MNTPTYDLICLLHLVLDAAESQDAEAHATAQRVRTLLGLGRGGIADARRRHAENVLRQGCESCGIHAPGGPLCCDCERGLADG